MNIFDKMFDENWMELSTVILTNEERESIHKLVEQLGPMDPTKINGELLTRIQTVCQNIPKPLLEKILLFKRRPNRYGTMLIRNLPTDNVLPPTPQDGGASVEKESFVSEYVLLLIMLYFGDPIAFEDEKNGLVIQNVCPVKGAENKQENTGSSILKYHTEDGFHPYKPDYLGLTCLRSDHDKMAKTTTASISNVIFALPSTAITLLRKPLYRLQISSSFKYDFDFDYSVVLPVLTGSYFEPEMCVHFSSMEGITPEAEWALNTLRKELSKATVEFILEPGDLLIIDNRVAAHSRTPFKPRYDGHDRWLQRIFTVIDFRRSNYSRAFDSHTSSPLHVEKYLNNHNS